MYSLISSCVERNELTPQGKELFARCHKSLSTLLLDIDDSIALTKPMEGVIRIAAVQDIGITVVSPIILEFSERYPRLEIDMVFEDQVVDLVASKIDVTVRAGRVKQQSLRGRKAGTVRFILVSSPKYLEKIPHEITIDRLQDLSFLAYQQMYEKGYFLLVNDGKQRRFMPKPRFRSGSTLALLQMAIDGADISLLPDFLCEAPIKQGALVQILKAWSTLPTPISVLTPAKKDLKSTVSVFSEFLHQRLAARLG